MTGYFITFEGPEGAGKTTLIQMLTKDLLALGLDVVMTREPGGIDIAEQIRSVILDPKNTAMDARTEALLYAASRRQHLAEKVIPALEKGSIVLCDRFVDSSLVYQGYARGLGIDPVYQINEFAMNGLMPQFTFYLDIDPKTGLERINRNKKREINRLDLEQLDFHHKVREGYHLLLEKFPERIHLIDADRPINQVLEEIKGKLLSFLELIK